MNIQLSDHFTYKKLIRFTLPSIAMMIVTSLYSVIDGLFVSNLVGADAFAALNLIFPFIMMFASISFMLSTGGSALIGKMIGQDRLKEANQIFSMLIYFTLLVGLASALFGLVFLEPISIILGASNQLLSHSMAYGRILLLALPFFMLQTTFQVFFVVAEKPMMSLIISVISGLTNIVLDFLFIYIFKWGISGAAGATALSQVVGGLIPLLYFFRKNKSILRLTKPRWDSKALLRICINGSSEMMTNLSLSVVNILYNFQLMKIAGQNGVAAYGVLMYVTFIFSSVFIGYAIGSAPIFSYHFGAKNQAEMKNLFKKSSVLILTASLSLTLIAQVLALPLSKVFVGFDPELLAMTVRALRLFSFSFLFSGINMFASSFFTALNNGKVSIFISFLRTLVFQVLMISLLPLLWGLNGVWIAVVLAELLTLAVSLTLFVIKNQDYNYL